MKQTEIADIVIEFCREYGLTRGAMIGLYTRLRIATDADHEGDDPAVEAAYIIQNKMRGARE